jgi:hypothetical protein
MCQRWITCKPLAARVLASWPAEGTGGIHWTVQSLGTVRSRAVTTAGLAGRPRRVAEAIGAERRPRLSSLTNGAG